MDRRKFMEFSALAGAGLVSSGLASRGWAVEMMLKDEQELDQLKYFERNEKGELWLRPGIADDIIDFHSHLGLSFLGSAAVDLDREDPETKTYFPQHGNPVDLSTYSAVSFTKASAKIAQNESVKQAYTKSGYSGTHTPKNLLKEMDHNRVTRSVILAIDYPLGLSHNSRVYMQAAKKYPRLLPFVSVHPYDALMERKVKSFRAQGALGMKIHPPMQFIRANNKKCMELTKLCGKLGMPCLFHTGASDISPKFQNDYPRIEYFWEPVQKQPETIFVLAHGGIHFYKELIELAKKNQNVWIELSGQPPAPIREMLDAGLEDRMLFGSDWPYYTESLPLAKVLLATEDAPLVRGKILHDNAEKLLERAAVRGA